MGGTIDKYYIEKFECGNRIQIEELWKKIIEYHCKLFSQTLSMSIVPLYFPPKVECIYTVSMYVLLHMYIRVIWRNSSVLYSAHWTDKKISWEYHIVVNVVRHNKLVQQLISRTKTQCVNVCYLNRDFAGEILFCWSHLQLYITCLAPWLSNIICIPPKPPAKYQNINYLCINPKVNKVNFSRFCLVYSYCEVDGRFQIHTYMGTGKSLKIHWYWNGQF